MKTTQRFTSLLPTAIVAASLAAGATTYAPPAYSCSFSDPWSCVTDFGSWVWDGAKGVGNWFKDVGLGIGQFAVRDIWGNLITTFSCPFTTNGAYGTTLACFPDNGWQTSRIRSALAFIYYDPRADHTYQVVSGGNAVQRYFQPSTFSIGRIAYIIDGYAPEASVFTLNLHDKDSDAVTTFVKTGSSAPVIVWPSAYTHYPTASGLAGTLVHEADHTRFGMHTCADWADTYEDGPYGTEIQYLARIYRTGHPVYGVAQYDRDFAWDKAAAKLGQICDGPAQRRLWNRFLTDTPNPTNPVLAAAQSTWQWAAPGAVTDISAIADGRVFGIGTDGIIYQSTAGTSWVQATPSPPSPPTLRDLLIQQQNPILGAPTAPAPLPKIIDLSVTPDGMIYGIGTDYAVYRSAGRRVSYLNGTFAVRPSPWAQVASPWVQNISVTPDGSIYGVGGDYSVYRTTVGGAWAQVAPPWVKNIAVTPDGTIYGVSSDNRVYRTVANRWYWDPVTTPSVSEIAVTPNGFIYGLGDAHDVWMTRPYDANLGTWINFATAWVSNLTVTPDGMLYGIGSDKNVYVHGPKWQ